MILVTMYLYKTDIDVRTIGDGPITNAMQFIMLTGFCFLFLLFFVDFLEGGGVFFKVKLALDFLH